MKVIDLLNKIANGEEVPTEIKYNNINYFWCIPCKIYERLEDDIKDLYNDIDDLNDEVEIIEEKKIPEKLETFKDKNNEIFLDDLCYKYMPIHKDSLSFNEQVIVDKLNEVLDYLKSKGE